MTRLRCGGLALILLTVAASGCAVSQKTPASNFVAAPSTGQQPLLTDTNSTTPPSDAGAAHTADEDFDLLEEELTEQMVEIPDPLEPANRLMFQVNDRFYFWLAKPVAQAYGDVVPEPCRLGIRNFFDNLTTPVRYVNCLLQGKGDSAGKELDRFLINTTVGVLGFGDPAEDKWKIQPPAEEDLGQTLGAAGWDNGFYIVWPLLGPSTLRDSLGLAGDYFLKPTSYVEPIEASITISGVKAANEGSFQIGQYETLKASAAEPYVAIRQAYIQYRNNQIQK